MNRSMLIDFATLEKLTRKPDFENIIIGTGVLARDMRKKLQLLGLKVPYMLGGVSDPDRDILHYNDLAQLGTPEQYRFIMCYDVDEWEFYAETISNVYRYLGNGATNHPQLVFFNRHALVYEHAGKLIIDGINSNVTLRDNLPYIIFGNENSDNPFRVHIVGSCHSGGIVQVTKKTMAMVLSDELKKAGFNSVVYTWGQPSSPIGNCISSLIRDVSYQKIDLLVLYEGLSGYQDPLRVGINNLLATKDAIVGTRNPFTRTMNRTYREKTSNGINHDTALPEVRAMQGQIFASYAKQYGFNYWEVITPSVGNIPVKKAAKFANRSEGYFIRQRERKEKALSVLNKHITKDYSDTFDDVDDVFSLFTEYGHMADTGNTLVAKRLAADILNEFGNINREKK